MFRWLHTGDQTWISTGEPCSRTNTQWRQVKLSSIDLDDEKIIIIFFVALVVITLTGTGTIPPSPWGGFYKNDPTLHQRRGDDTVPSSILFAILFVAPLITVSSSLASPTSSLPSSTTGCLSVVLHIRKAWNGFGECLGSHQGYLLGLPCGTLVVHIF